MIAFTKHDENDRFSGAVVFVDQSRITHVEEVETRRLHGGYYKFSRIHLDTGACVDVTESLQLVMNRLQPKET